MSDIKKRVKTLVLAMVMALSVLVSGVVDVSADYSAGSEPLKTLEITIQSGTYTYFVGNTTVNYSTNRYKMANGGYLFWHELFNTVTGDGENYFDSSNLDKLTSGAKRSFLEDVFRMANYIAEDTNKGNHTGDTAPTNDTVTDLYEIAQNESGMAGTLLASIMTNTKPDYATANRLYEPFSGIVGTILGIVSILIMALLGITMALDIAYITIPAFQMALGGDGEGTTQGGDKKGMSRIISQEAHKAIAAANGGQGGQSGDGSYKAAVGIYFKYRWKGLVLLGVCLLYLVQGQIYSFVGWFIDLFSGFLGF